MVDCWSMLDLVGGRACFHIYVLHIYLNFIEPYTIEYVALFSSCFYIQRVRLILARNVYLFAEQ